MEATGIGRSWRKASYSGNGGGSCVEVGQASRGVAVRDTKQEGKPSRTVLAFEARTWNRLLTDVKTGKIGLQTNSKGA